MTAIFLFMITLQNGPFKIGRVSMQNHLILAAGVLGTTGASLARMLEKGAGSVVTKSIGPVPREGHPGPCLVILDDGVLNAMGLCNPSSEFIDEIEPLRGKPVMVSIFGGNPEEFAEVASWFVPSAMGFELNVSCPHATGYGASIGTNPDLVRSCTEAVTAFKKPTWVKLTPNVTDITQIGRAAEEGGADALVAINTVKAMRISIPVRKPVLGNRYGGLSGKAVFPIAVRAVYDLYEACDIPIIGCGGVCSASDVVEMMMAGASAVEIGSAAGQDISIFQRISQDLYHSDGISYQEIVGCAHD